jgi:hypothetical protein
MTVSTQAGKSGTPAKANVQIFISGEVGNRKTLVEIIGSALDALCVANTHRHELGELRPTTLPDQEARRRHLADTVTVELIELLPTVSLAASRPTESEIVAAEARDPDRFEQD